MNLWEKRHVRKCLEILEFFVSLAHFRVINGITFCRLFVPAWPEICQIQVFKVDFLQNDASREKRFILLFCFVPVVTVLHSSII